MEIKLVRLENIQPYEKNPRKNDEAVKYVANSIKEFGFKVPIIIDQYGTIIAGHTRYKASKKLKLEEVPCIVADDLTKEQIQAFRLADNKVAEQAEWDLSLLSEELADLSLCDIDMGDFGFDLEPMKEDAEVEEEEETLFDDIEKLDSHYGVPYQGNKSRIADIIINILPAGKRLVDLFGGVEQSLIVPCLAENGKIIYTTT